jgi:hypothetical protein
MLSEAYLMILTKEGGKFKDKFKKVQKSGN